MGAAAMRLRNIVLLTALAAPARAAQPFLDFRTAAGSGSALVSSTEGGTSFDKERYRISARLRTSRLGAEAPGAREEYSLGVTRELYYVTVSGRLSTSPPNSQGAGYHVAAGAASFTFYGTELAPEHPELSPVIWESSGPAPDPAALDRTWITRFSGAYTNINNHIATNNGLFILVEGAWQFSLLETYSDDTTIGFQGGSNRYNRILDGSSPVILQNVVDYWGNYLPVTGWPKNWQSLRADRKFGAVELSAAGTRLNIIDGTDETMMGVEASWTRGKNWTVRAGLERLTGRRATRTAFAFGFSRRW
jgi:hypothetical protein